MAKLPIDAAQRWDAAIKAWLADIQAENADENDITAFRAYLDAMFEMLQHMARDAAPRDTWEGFFSGSTVLLRSGKLSHEFSLEVDDAQCRLSLACALTLCHHLPKMPDEFWQLLIELHNLGTFEFLPNLATSGSKSVVWTIMQEFMVAQEAPQGQRGPDYDSGQLQVSWPLATPIDQIYIAALDAFRRLYRANYMLYRHDYILRSSREKNARVRP
jgi:hypothetical protein